MLPSPTTATVFGAAFMPVLPATPRSPPWARPSHGRFDDDVEAGGAAVGHPRLAPHLDRERHVDE